MQHLGLNLNLVRAALQLWAVDQKSVFHSLAQRYGKRPDLIHMRADGIVKQRVADQPNRRERHQIKRRADDQQESNEHLRPNGMKRVNPCR